MKALAEAGNNSIMARTASDQLSTTCISTVSRTAVKFGGKNTAWGGEAVDLLQVHFGDGIEHSKAVVEKSCSVAVDLPGEAERDAQNIMHIVSRCAMSQVPCTKAAGHAAFEKNNEA